MGELEKPTTVRIRADLLRQIKEIKENENRSLNNTINQILIRGLNAIKEETSI